MSTVPEKLGRKKESELHLYIARHTKTTQVPHKKYTLKLAFDVFLILETINNFFAILNYISTTSNTFLPIRWFKNVSEFTKGFQL